MKIAIFCGIFKDKSDGSAKALMELSKTLSKHNITHQVYSPITQSLKDSACLETVELSSIPIFFYPEYKIGFLNKAMKKKLDAFKPDIIHIGTPDITGFMALKYAKKNNIPVVNSYHTDFPSYFSYFNVRSLVPLLWKYFQYVYGQSQKILPPSMVMQKKLQAHGIHKHKDDAFCLWSRGISPNIFAKATSKNPYKDTTSQKPFRILYVGRMVWYKNLKVIANISSHIQSEHPDLFKQLEFCFVGDGPARPDLEKQLPQARFCGAIAPENIAQYYAHSNVFLFPSITETFGQVIQEALANALPCIVSNQGGCQEIVTKAQAGFVHDANDTHAFVKSLIDLFNSQSLMNKMQKQALSYAKKQTWDHANQAVIDAYTEICN